MQPKSSTLGGDYTIHLAFKEEGSGQWRIACMPTVTNLATNAFFPNYLRSNEPAAVSCAECKKTEAYTEARRNRGGGL